MQLGHGGCSCPYPSVPVNDFVVVDTRGLHTVTLTFCECISCPSKRVQLLQTSWFSSSTKHPHTAFTFDVLNSFQLANLQGKISAYDYYYLLLHKSDNVGVCNLKVCRV